MAIVCRDPQRAITPLPDFNWPCTSALLHLSSTATLGEYYIERRPPGSAIISDRGKNVVDSSTTMRSISCVIVCVM
jgi:hypothetical protein